MSADDQSTEVLRAFAAALKPLVNALLEPYRQTSPDAYVQMLRQAEKAEVQLHVTAILSNKPLDVVLRMVTAEAVATIAVVTVEGGILTLRPDSADLN